METPPTPRLGETPETLILSTSGDNREVTLAMVSQARHSVYIYSRDLEHAVYDTAQLEEALFRLVRSGPRAHVYILLRDSDKAVKNGHRLVKLAQRLSSKVQIKSPDHQYGDYNESFLVVDETGLIRRPLADRYEGTASFKDPLNARDRARFFLEVWERSSADLQLRALHL